MTTSDVLPKTMRAMWWSGPGHPLAVKELETPRVEDENDVILRVRAAVFGAALVRACVVGHPKMTPPAVLGTLVAGDVLARGAAVQGLDIGTRVTLDPHPPCGRCPQCRAGAVALCSARHRVEPGALAQVVRVRGTLASHLHRIPDGMPYETAVYTEIVACVVEATRVAEIDFGDVVVIVGCGPIALLQIHLARLRGASEVVCLVNHPERLDAIRSAGAVPVDVVREDPVQAVSGLTGGRGADVVFEAVGRAETYALSLQLVRPGGTVVGFGGCPPGSQLTLDPNDLHYRAIRFIGSYHYRPGTFERALRLLAAGGVSLSSVLTHRLSLERIAEAPRIAREADCFTLIVEP